MIHARKLVRVLNGNHIPNVLHHTNGGRISPGIGTDIACLTVGDVIALVTIEHIRLQLVDTVSQQEHIVFLGLHQMQCQTQGCALSYARQFGDLIDCVF